MDKSLVGIIDEAKKARHCVMAGAYELAYEHLQNIEDELTTMEIKRRIETKTI